MGHAPRKVIFACVHNAGRSQMAAALFNRIADPAKATAVSAGTQPAARVHPVVARVMAETGIDLSDAVPRRLDDALAASAHWLITMGCGEQCPVVPGVERDDWPIEDPKDQPLETVRITREGLRERIERFVSDRGWAPD